MDKIDLYRSIIKEIFADYAKTRIPAGNYDPGYQLIFDEPNGHYLLYVNTWRELKRLHFCVFHIDIINEKLWVQEDATDFDLVGELELKGIPKTDIVLGFHAPYKRPFTDYAIA
jgi:hypothetical protein